MISLLTCNGQFVSLILVAETLWTPLFLIFFSYPLKYTRIPPSLCNFGVSSISSYLITYFIYCICQILYIYNSRYWDIYTHGNPWTPCALVTLPFGQRNKFSSTYSFRAVRIISLWIINYVILCYMHNSLLILLIWTIQKDLSHLFICTTRYSQKILFIKFKTQYLIKKLNHFY